MVEYGYTISYNSHGLAAEDVKSPKTKPTKTAAKKTSPPAANNSTGSPEKEKKRSSSSRRPRCMYRLPSRLLDCADESDAESDTGSSCSCSLSDVGCLSASCTRSGPILKSKQSFSFSFSEAFGESFGETLAELSLSSGAVPIPISIPSSATFSTFSQSFAQSLCSPPDHHNCPALSPSLSPLSSALSSPRAAAAATGAPAITNKEKGDREPQQKSQSGSTSASASAGSGASSGSSRKSRARLPPRRESEPATTTTTTSASSSTSSSTRTPPRSRTSSSSLAMYNPQASGPPPYQMHSRHPSSGRIPSAADLRRLSNGLTPPITVNGTQSSSSSISMLNSNANGGPQAAQQNGLMGFDGPRSPPGNKSRSAPYRRGGGGREAGAGTGADAVSTDLSHVPCKFFRQGACQAGKACPFLHSIDTTTEQAPCKYFAKGNCKFGAKCALAHILPDGRRVNRPTLNIGSGQLNIGGRVNPEIYHNQGSALHTSLLHATLQNQTMSSTPFLYDDFPPIMSSPGHGGLSPHPDSKYGSPREDNRLPISPLASSNRGLSILDAPLPPSLDSNDISYFARHGPIAASVPSKFGMESPPSSLPPQSDAVKSLYASAYDDSRGKAAPGQSPPGGSDDSLGARPMHSTRVSRPKFFSSSLPRQHVPLDDWETTTSEEGYLPAGLHDMLGTQDRFRRGDDGAGGIVSIGGLGESSSKVGSPITSSPSRFGPLFIRHRREEDVPSPLSNLGHVGSPLRTTSSHQLGTSPGMRAISRPTSGDVSPHFASPPRAPPSISGISQQLQRVGLGRQDDSMYSPSHAGASKFLNAAGSRSLSRALSSSSIGARGSHIGGAIDEEKDEFVFSMDTDEADEMKRDLGEQRWTGLGLNHHHNHGHGHSHSGSNPPPMPAIGDERRPGSGPSHEHEDNISGLYFNSR